MKPTMSSFHWIFNFVITNFYHDFANFVSAKDLGENKYSYPKFNVIRWGFFIELLTGSKVRLKIFSGEM